MVARRLSNQAEVLFSEGASALETNMLIALESIRRLPTMTAHRVLTQGLEMLSTLLPPLVLPQTYAVSSDPPVLAAASPNVQTILLTYLLGADHPKPLQVQGGEVTAPEFSEAARFLLISCQRRCARIFDCVEEQEILAVHSHSIFEARFSSEGGSGLLRHARCEDLCPSHRFRQTTSKATQPFKIRIERMRLRHMAGNRNMKAHVEPY
jgi:hypothetical protein